MNDRDQDRVPKQRAKRKRPPEWQHDLNAEHRSGQKIGPHSDAQVQAEWTAFHLRKRGLDLGSVNKEELAQVPALNDEPKPGQK
jgi:hypothetical protein